MIKKMVEELRGKKNQNLEEVATGGSRFSFLFETQSNGSTHRWWDLAGSCSLLPHLHDLASSFQKWFCCHLAYQSLGSGRWMSKLGQIMFLLFSVVWGGVMAFLSMLFLCLVLLTVKTFFLIPSQFCSCSNESTQHRIIHRKPVLWLVLCRKSLEKPKKEKCRSLRSLQFPGQNIVHICPESQPPMYIHT